MENPSDQESLERKLETENLEQKPEVEMPDEFFETNDQIGRWSEVIEDKVLGVSYREKIIELPKHRQEETGVKRIRRRELLLPFPIGLYVSPSEKKNRDIQHVLNSDENEFEKENQIQKIKNKGEYLPSYRSPLTGVDEDQSKAIEQYKSGISVLDNPGADILKGIVDYEKRPATLKKVYEFLTDRMYPSNDAWVHQFEYSLAECPIKNNELPKHKKETVDLFTKEGMYFQKVSDLNNKEGVERRKGTKHLYLVHGNENNRGKMWSGTYTTPVFIFGTKNKIFNELIKDHSQILGRHPVADEIIVDLPKDSSEFNNSLRWCHSELALIPTKRSLNVLFFETK